MSIKRNREFVINISYFFDVPSAFVPFFQTIKTEKSYFRIRILANLLYAWPFTVTLTHLTVYVALHFDCDTQTIRLNTYATSIFFCVGFCGPVRCTNTMCFVYSYFRGESLYSNVDLRCQNLLRLKWKVHGTIQKFWIEPCVSFLCSYADTCDGFLTHTVYMYPVVLASYFQMN